MIAMFRRLFEIGDQVVGGTEPEVGIGGIVHEKKTIVFGRQKMMKRSLEFINLKEAVHGTSVMPVEWLRNCSPGWRPCRQNVGAR